MKHASDSEEPAKHVSQVMREMQREVGKKVMIKDDWEENAKHHQEMGAKSVENIIKSGDEKAIKSALNDASISWQSTTRQIGETGEEVTHFMNQYAKGEDRNASERKMKKSYEAFLQAHQERAKAIGAHDALEKALKDLKKQPESKKSAFDGLRIGSR